MSDAFAHLGIATENVTTDDDASDLLVRLPGETLSIQLKRRALISADAIDRLLGATPPGSLLLVVADRVTQEAREKLLARQAGYLDLRGRLAVRADRLVVDAEVPSLTSRHRRSAALTGKVGLEVAATILMNPERRASVRDVARRLSRSPSTVSEVLSAMREDGLIDADNVLDGTELFWQTADRWPAERTLLATLPPPGNPTITDALRLGLDEETGWALTDSAAAVAYGAPLAVRTAQTLDFFVPDRSVLRRASTLLGATTSSSSARATVRVAPIRAAVTERIDNRVGNPYEWPLAHPVLVALDLAQDVGRGREVLDAWHPPEQWRRVW